MARELTNNYITILGWMVSDLHLKGNELLIYALLHGFCQDGDNTFTGSIAYIQAWTGLTYQGTANVLKSLVEKKLLEKVSVQVNGITFCKYRTLDPPKNFGTHPNNLGPTPQKIWDNIDNIQESSNEDCISIKPQTPKKFDFRKALLGLGVTSEVVDAWMQVRKAKKAVNTEIAFNSIAAEIARSGKPANDCIRFAVVKSWAGFRASWMEGEERPLAAAGPAPRRKAGDNFSRMMDVGRELGIIGETCDEQ